jgi:signal transduction histidine kinase
MSPSIVVSVWRSGAWIRPWLFDGAVAALVAALALLQYPLPWSIKICGLLMALVLIWRRHLPVTVLTAIYLLAPAHLLLDSYVQLFDVAVLIAMYSTVLYRPQLRWGVVAGAGASVGVLVAAIVEDRRFGNFWAIIWVVGAVTVATWVTAYSVRTRRLYVETLEERAATLERERDHLALLAVADERAAIAREVHDVVAHSLSVMIVQADAAGYTLDGPQAPARKALATIASTGREALEDMGRVVQLLRGAQPSLPTPRENMPPAGAIPGGAVISGVRLDDARQSGGLSISASHPETETASSDGISPNVVELKGTSPDGFESGEGGPGAAAPGDARPAGLGSGGAASAGVGSGGVGSGGVGSGGVGSGGVGSGGVGSGGVGSGGVASGGAASGNGNDAFDNGTDKSASGNAATAGVMRDNGPPCDVSADGSSSGAGPFRGTSPDDSVTRADTALPTIAARGGLRRNASPGDKSHSDASGGAARPDRATLGGSVDGDSIVRRRVGLAELDNLIQRSGLRVVRETIGTPGGLSAAQELTTYRIVQESLTNALRHAGTDATVTLRLAFSARAVRIEVRDDGGGRNGPATAADRLGHGLVGMRERVAMHGGDLVVGPRPDGGWQVAATIPRTSGGAA